MSELGVFNGEPPTPVASEHGQLVPGSRPHSSQHPHRASSSRSASLSFPIGSLLSSFRELRTRVALGTVDATGNSLSTARVTFRLSREVQRETSPGTSSGQRHTRPSDASSNQGLVRHLPPSTGSSTGSSELEEDTSGSSTAEEGDEMAQGQDEELSAGAAAERYRLSTGIPGFDFQDLQLWLERTIPFLLILLLVFLVNHIRGVAQFFFMGYVLYRANEVMRKHALLKEDGRSGAFTRRLVTLAMEIICSCTLIVLINYRLQLWHGLVLLDAPTELTSVWDCVFRVTALDFFARCMGLLVKIAVVVLHSAVPDELFRRRAQVLTAVEHAILFYRCLVPVPVWMLYFKGAHLGAALGACAMLGYIVAKVMSLGERARTMLSAVKAVLKSETAFGQYATHEEVMEAGNSCAICQEEMKNPLKLHCSHVFCDSCITEWLNREPTCPMCRAVIRPANLKSYGDGTTSLLPQIF